MNMRAALGYTLSILQSRIHLRNDGEIPRDRVFGPSLPCSHSGIEQRACMALHAHKAILTRRWASRTCVEPRTLMYLLHRR
jgi:hypothetical protein